MPIYIKLSDESHQENWAMIELQGDIISKSDGTSLQFIGDLHFMKDGTPVLIIGNNLLLGKEGKCEKPFAVLEKTKAENGETEYIVKAIVRKKLLFKTRPKPILL